MLANVQFCLDYLLSVISGTTAAGLQAGTPQVSSESNPYCHTCIIRLTLPTQQNSLEVDDRLLSDIHILD